MKNEMPRELVLNGSVMEKVLWFARHKDLKGMVNFLNAYPLSQEQWSEFWRELSI
jgi:CRISPR/Cas system CMR subunit Cmr6 (Cas7 group RAMP superfamily)